MEMQPDFPQTEYSYCRCGSLLFPLRGIRTFSSPFSYISAVDNEQNVAYLKLYFNFVDSLDENASRYVE